MRHREGGRDDNGAWLAGSDANLLGSLSPRRWDDFTGREREGEQVRCTVYFLDSVTS